MAEPLFLGVDGGGTGCRALVADADGGRLGIGTGGPANVRLGIEAVFAEILGAVRAALAAAGQERPGLERHGLGRLHAGLGLAGLAMDEERRRLFAFPHPFASLEADTDAYVACLGAHGGGDGAVLVVGTGTCGLALAGGRRINVGGWGAALSDHGSGAWLGREAVRTALQAHEDIVPPTALSAAVMSRFHGDPARAVRWADTARPGDFGVFARLVVDHAKANDPLARSLMRAAGEEVGRLIRALSAQGAPSVALVGGLAPHVRPWLPEDAKALVREPLGDALDGAVLMARRAWARRCA